MEEYKNYATDPILAKEAYQFVMDLHASLKKKRKPLESVWAECQDAYRCVESKTWFQGAGPYCSPDLRDAVLTIVPKVTKAIWYTDIPFDLVPVGEEGEDQDLSEINQKVLEWDFRNLKVYLKYVDAMFQKAIYGTTIVKTPPHFEWITKNIREYQQKKLLGFPMGKKELTWKRDMVREFMGTDLIPVDIMDFWIDPATISHGSKDAVEYGDCIESIVLKKTDLEEGKKSGIYVNLDKIENDFVGSKRKDNDGSTKSRIKRAGHIDQPEEGGKKQSRGNKSYEIKECYADFDLGRGVEPCLIVIGADKECIRLQPWEGEKPYLSSRYYGNGYNKEFYGTGIIEPNLSNHYERNATRKQMIMARTIGLNMEILSNQNGIPNKPDKLRSAAGKVHYVKDINGIKPFEKPIGPVLTSGMAYENLLKEETRNSTGNTLAISGQPTPQNSTAAGINLLQTSGNEKFTLPLQTDETGLLEPYVKRCLQNNIDYRKEDFVIRLTDKKPLRVYPDKLSANFDVYSKGSSELQNKQIRQAGLLKAWEIDIQAAQMEAMMYGQPLTKFFELKKEIHANLGLSNPDQFLIDPKDLANPQMQLLQPEAEWVLLKRMADGLAPMMPILIQPGEDYKDHYEKHKAKMMTEEFNALPDQAKQIWTLHILAYERVLGFLESRKKEAEQEKVLEGKEVAVSQ